MATSMLNNQMVNPKSGPKSKDLKMPTGIALDLTEGRMYWAEDGTKMIRSATLYGDDLRDVIEKKGRDGTWDTQAGPYNLYNSCRTCVLYIYVYIYIHIRVYIYIII